MNTEIYLTIKRDETRLVISGELALLREFVATFNDCEESPTIARPDPSSELLKKVETR